uniref:Uncharacterized protein n=1 Tax=Sinocyclocheilus anshuiensis TaxID=1608454 RepID=A0A671N0W0_9TELE
MDRVKSSMQQVPNPIPKVLSRRTGGANSLEAEKENFERSQVRNCKLFFSCITTHSFAASGVVNILQLTNISYLCCIFSRLIRTSSI